MEVEMRSEVYNQNYYWGTREDLEDNYLNTIRSELVTSENKSFLKDGSSEQNYSVNKKKRSGFN